MIYVGYRSPFWRPFKERRAKKWFRDRNRRAKASTRSRVVKRSTSSDILSTMRSVSCRSKTPQRRKASSEVAAENKPQQYILRLDFKTFHLNLLKST